MVGWREGQGMDCVVTGGGWVKGGWRGREVWINVLIAETCFNINKTYYEMVIILELFFLFFSPEMRVW